MERRHRYPVPPTHPHQTPWDSFPQHQTPLPKVLLSPPHLPSAYINPPVPKGFHSSDAYFNPTTKMVIFQETHTCQSLPGLPEPQSWSRTQPRATLQHPCGVPRGVPVLGALVGTNRAPPEAPIPSPQRSMLSPPCPPAAGGLSSEPVSCTGLKNSPGTPPKEGVSPPPRNPPKVPPWTSSPLPSSSPHGGSGAPQTPLEGLGAVWGCPPPTQPAATSLGAD